MDWKQIESYRNFLIWVLEHRDGRYWASVTSLPEHGAMATAPPGAVCVPEDFDSERAAVHAAKAYIEQQRKR